MGGEHIFCYNCIHFDNINMCKTRAQFVKSSKGRYCQDFVDKAKMEKPKEEIPQPVKLLEEVPVAPVKTQLELSKEEIKPEIKKVSLIRKILDWIIRRIKWLVKKK